MPDRETPQMQAVRRMEPAGIEPATSCLQKTDGVPRSVNDGQSDPTGPVGVVQSRDAASAT